jgi:O-antigen/teichoic acid export membrane protein
VASTYGVGVYLAGQIALTPLLLHFWGEERYAQWLILFAIPAYFALSDAGISNSFGNALSIEVEQKRYAEAVVMARAVSYWQVVLWAIVFVVLLVGLAVLPLRNWMAIPEMPYETFVAVSVILAVYSLGSLQGGYYTALFRVGGEYSRLVRLLGHLRLAEVVVHGFVVALGCGLVAAAATLLAIRSVFYCWCHKQRERLMPGLTRTGPRPWGAFAALLPSGLSFMAFPIGNMVVNQGSALVLKHLAGPGEVIALAAGRQVARLFLNLSGIIFQSVQPEMSIAFAKSDSTQMKRLQALALTPVLWAAPFFIALMAVVAPWAIGIWTNSTVLLSAGISAALAAEAVVNGLGNNAMLVGWSTNRLRALWLAYIITQGLALTIASNLVTSNGLIGLLGSFVVVSLGHVAVSLWVAGSMANTSATAILAMAFRGSEFRSRLRSLI